MPKDNKPKQPVKTETTESLPIEAKPEDKPAPAEPPDKKSGHQWTPRQERVHPRVLSPTEQALYGMERVCRALKLPKDEYLAICEQSWDKVQTEEAERMSRATTVVREITNAAKGDASGSGKYVGRRTPAAPTAKTADPLSKKISLPPLQQSPPPLRPGKK